MLDITDSYGRPLDRHIEPEPNSGCWIWIGKRNKTGYPGLTRNYKSVLAHRLVYEVLVGPIPYDKEIDHLCRNRSCVNPAHMEVVTHRENARRGTAGWNLTKAGRALRASKA